MRLALENDLIKNAQAGEAGLERLITAVWPEAYRIAFGALLKPIRVKATMAQAPMIPYSIRFLPYARSVAHDTGRKVLTADAEF